MRRKFRKLTKNLDAQILCVEFTRKIRAVTLIQRGKQGRMVVTLYGTQQSISEELYAIARWVRRGGKRCQNFKGFRGNVHSAIARIRLGRTANHP